MTINFFKYLNLINNGLNQIKIFLLITLALFRNKDQKRWNLKITQY